MLTEPVLQFPGYAAIGALAGLVAGLFGLGGGVVVVPALLLLFAWQGFPAQWIPIAAVATSLAAMVVTAAASVWAHVKLGSLNWYAVNRLLPGVVLGSMVGAWLAERLPGSWLKTGFAIYLLVVAGQMIGSFQPKSGEAQPSAWLMLGAGGAIGTLSAILGIGGGTLTVPFLVWGGFSMQAAVAVSSVCGFPIALAGTLSYAVLGWNTPNLPPGNLGYVYLPAFFGIASTSLLTAPLGARLAYRLPGKVLKRWFAGVLILISLRILLSG